MKKKDRIKLKAILNYIIVNKIKSFIFVCCDANTLFENLREAHCMLISWNVPVVTNYTHGSLEFFGCKISFFTPSKDVTGLNRKTVLFIDEFASVKEKHYARFKRYEPK